MEQWREFGNYEVSNIGRIRRAVGGAGCRAGRIIAQWVTRKHATVLLWHDGKSKHHSVADLVAHCFIGLKPQGWEVNHIDGDPLNNSVENLEYCTDRKSTRLNYSQVRI